MLGKMVDVPFADQFIKRNGIGVLRLPFGREESEQYLRRLEKRKGLVSSLMDFCELHVFAWPSPLMVSNGTILLQMGDNVGAACFPAPLRLLTQC